MINIYLSIHLDISKSEIKLVDVLINNIIVASGISPSDMEIVIRSLIDYGAGLDPHLLNRHARNTLTVMRRMDLHSFKSVQSQLFSLYFCPLHLIPGNLGITTMLLNLDTRQSSLVLLLLSNGCELLSLLKQSGLQLTFLFQ